MKSLVLSVSLSVSSLVAYSSASPEAVCRDFLGHLPTIYHASTGTQIVFTGEFVTVKPEIAKRLDAEFPDYDFRIAKMRYLHWGMEPVNLLLVIHRSDPRVCTYLWDLWFTDEPFSFDTVFGGIHHDGDKALSKLTLLGELICFQMGWTVGTVTTKDRAISVPLVNRDKVEWRTLVLRLDPSLGERSLVFKNPKREGSQKP